MMPPFSANAPTCRTHGTMRSSPAGRPGGLLTLVLVMLTLASLVAPRAHAGPATGASTSLAGTSSTAVDQPDAALPANGGSSALADTASARARVHTDSGEMFQPCPLGSSRCPPRPITYQQCRPNSQLSFYKPALPGDTNGRETASTEVFAEHIGGQDNLYHLRGDVSLERWDQRLTSDHLDYNQLTTAYDARGNVTWQDSSVLLSASRMHGQTENEHAQASDVHYQMLTSRGNGRADHAELRGANHSRFTHASYSTCDPGHHLWEFRGGRITTDQLTGRGVAHDATMRIGGIPFLYLPKFSFPIDDRRKSGFLYPTFANHGHSGLMLSIPYYLNLAPNFDATLTPTLFTQRGAMLGTQFRYRFGGTKGKLDIDYMPRDRLSGSSRRNGQRNIRDNADRYLAKFKNKSVLGGGWRFKTSIKHASDKYYFQDFESDLKKYTTLSSLHSKAYLKGGGNWWSAGLGLDHYQNVDPAFGTNHVRYKRWPRGTLDLDIPLSRHFTFGMNSEVVAFRKNNAVEGNRLDVYPALKADFRGASWFVRPRASYRYTRYDLVHDPDRYGFSDHSPSRSMPIMSLDTGLIFERDTSLFGHDYTQTLEPRLYYLYAPYRDQSDQPIFDTKVMQMAWWQLFSPNRFSGADRQMNANNLTAAVSTRFLDADGIEKATFSFGQIRYFARQRVHRGLHTRPTNFDGSEYVARMGLQLNPKWRLNAVYQWDPEDRHTSVGTLQFQRRLGHSGILNFSYRYRRHYMEQLDASAVVPINEHWRMLGRWNLALRERNHFVRGDPKTLAALLGFEYEGCCMNIRLLGRHYVRNIHGDTSNSVMLQIQFKGLGSFSPQTENFLHHAIVGYQ